MLGDGLTFANLLVVSMGSLGWFRTITIPMQSVQGDKLGSCKNIFQKAPLFKCDF